MGSIYDGDKDDRMIISQQTSSDQNGNNDYDGNEMMTNGDKDDRVIISQQTSNQNINELNGAEDSPWRLW